MRAVVRRYIGLGKFISENFRHLSAADVAKLRGESCRMEDALNDWRDER
jgi:hypothetical protein